MEITKHNYMNVPKKSVNKAQVVISVQSLFRPKPITCPDRFIFVFQKVNLDYGNCNYYGNKSKRNDEYDCNNNKHSIVMPLHNLY